MGKIRDGSSEKLQMITVDIGSERIEKCSNMNR
jgi:hypothetical protein